MARNYNKKKWRKPKAQKNKLSIGPPPYTVSKLRYTETFTTSPGAVGIPNGRVYRLQSCYDPNYGLGGGQPRYFDQYMAMYQKFVVLGAKITLETMNQDTTRNNRVGMMITNDNALRTDPIDYNQPKVGRKTTLAPIGSGGSIQNLRMNYSSKKWFGVKNLTTDDDFAGSSGGNPERESYLHCVTWSPNGVDSDSVTFVLTIDYIVKFFSPYIPNES